MARGKGTANLAASLEVLAGAPLDARDVCPTVADLYVAANWPYKYIGMKTTVQATGDTYRLVNLDVTQESSWVLDGGSGGGGHTIEGDGTAVTDRDTLNFKDMSVSDDSTNEKTDVKPHRLTQSELADIISPLPFFDFSNPGAEAFIFSTNERVIGQWIDGKPLYQKVISQTYSSLPADTTSMGGKLLDVTSLSIDKPVNLRVLLPSSFRPTGNFMQNNNSNVTNGIDVTFKSPTAINLQAGSAISPYLTNATLDFVLQYTKTTDQPVATGEKIVGQWIDGKPLFEKTVDCGALPNNNTTRTNHNISNLDMVVTLFGCGVQGNSKFILPSHNLTGGNDPCRLAINDSVIVISTSVQYGGSYPEHTYVTVRYTKT